MSLETLLLRALLTLGGAVSLVLGVRAFSRRRVDVGFPHHPRIHQIVFGWFTRPATRTGRIAQLYALAPIVLGALAIYRAWLY